MKILLISDVHLTHKFKKRKYDYLYSLISKYEKVIIVGDFWSAYDCKFNRFVNSKWEGLFPLLKERHAIYIYGNHDRKRWCDERVYRFCDLAQRDYSLQIGETDYHISHGVEYLVDSINNEIFMFLHRKLKAYVLSHFLERTVLKLLGYNKFIEIGRKLNEIQRFEIGDDTRFSIVGHTHSPELLKRKRYANLGFINYGYASYAVISDKGIKLFKENY